MRVLYVIGNGFDLYHNIATSYCDFRNFVKEQNNDLFETIEKYLPVGENWNEIECSFPDIFSFELSDEMASCVESGKEWRQDDTYFLSTVTDKLSDLPNVLYSWVSSINLKAVEKKLPLLSDDLYLTFNYTKTLEKTYGINSDNICHIHGCVSDNNCSKLIFGHAESDQEINKLVWTCMSEESPLDVSEFIESEDDKAGHKRYRAVCDLFDQGQLEPTSPYSNEFVIWEYLKEWKKPVDTIINDKYKFFEKLSNIKTIYVIGHSLSVVDLPYFQEIKKLVSSNAIWNVTYHTEEEKKYILDMLVRNLGIFSGDIRLSQL